MNRGVSRHKFVDVLIHVKNNSYRYDDHNHEDVGAQEFPHQIPVYAVQVEYAAEQYIFEGVPTAFQRFAACLDSAFQLI